MTTGLRGRFRLGRINEHITAGLKMEIQIRRN